MKLAEQLQVPEVATTKPVQTIGGRALKMLPPPVRWNWRALQRLVIVLVLLCPAIVSTVYFGLIASDRYVSESTFVVRSSTRSSAGGFAAFLRMVGVSSSQDDTFAVHDFITSRDALEQLKAKVDLAKIYSPPGADPLSRYPNILYGDGLDEFSRYMKSRIVVTFNSNTGISTLRVQAYSPEEAQLINRLLLELSEQVINRMNVRIHGDAVRFAQQEVDQTEARLRAIQVAITNFRNRELQIDPNRSSILVLELVGKLSEEASRVSAQMAELSVSSPNSPMIAALERRSEAIRGQIALEKARITDGSDGLASKIAKFEELMLEREMTVKTLATAIVSLDTARTEARRQQLYLERIAGPTLPDYAKMPERLFEILSFTLANLVVLLVGWLIKTGITEHAPKLENDQR